MIRNHPVAASYDEIARGVFQNMGLPTLQHIDEIYRPVVGHYSHAGSFAAASGPASTRIDSSKYAPGRPGKVFASAGASVCSAVLEQALNELQMPRRIGDLVIDRTIPFEAKGLKRRNNGLGRTMLFARRIDVFNS
jgi:hypothetical protein